MRQALKHRATFEGVQTCMLTDTFGNVSELPMSHPFTHAARWQVVDKIVAANVHRLIVVDKAGHLLGVISLSDILGFCIGR